MIFREKNIEFDSFCFWYDTVVPETYIWHSTTSSQDPTKIRMADTKPKAKTTSSRLSFPQKVYNLLKLCEDNHQEHIVSWMNDGTAFKVHDLDRFEHELLPKYFNTRKYVSFTRSLCFYGFDCVRTGRQTGICKLNLPVCRHRQASNSLRQILTTYRLAP